MEARDAMTRAQPLRYKAWISSPAKATCASCVIPFGQAAPVSSCDGNENGQHDAVAQRQKGEGLSVGHAKFRPDEATAPKQDKEKGMTDADATGTSLRLHGGLVGLRGGSISERLARDCTAR